MKTWIACAALALLPAVSSAQQALDRKKVPPPGKTPELRVPAWTRTTLSNGAELLVAEKHELPLISFSITFLGGADQFEPAGKQSVASLTAALLSEGTKTRDAEALSNALQLLGRLLAETDRHPELARLLEREIALADERGAAPPHNIPIRYY